MYTLSNGQNARAGMSGSDLSDDRRTPRVTRVGGRAAEDQVAVVLADVRRRLPRTEDKAWAPEFFGIVDGADLPADLATNTDDYLAVSGFGRDSL